MTQEFQERGSCHGHALGLVPESSLRGQRLGNWLKSGSTTKFPSLLSNVYGFIYFKQVYCTFLKPMYHLKPIPMHVYLKLSPTEFYETYHTVCRIAAWIYAKSFGIWQIMNAVHLEGSFNIIYTDLHAEDILLFIPSCVLLLLKKIFFVSRLQY